MAACNPFDFALCDLVSCEDFAAIHELTSLCFKSKDYLKNFPQVFKPQNAGYFFSIKDDAGKLTCFCSIYPTYFISSSTLLTGYCIGSVCTHPDYRNKGLASQVLALAEAKAKLNQGDFAYLFSAPNKMYEKSGFQLCGQTVLAEFGLKTAQKLKTKYFNCKINIVQNLNAEDMDKIWSFIVCNSKPSESILSFLEFKDIIQTKNMKIVYLTHNQQLCSVCFLNKGDDFENVIHGIYYLNVDYAIVLIKDLFLKEGRKKLYFFPGAFFEDFSHLFNYKLLPAMYVKILNNSFTLDNISKIFVRSIQGT